MIFSTKRGKMLLGGGALALAALSFGTARYAIGSDHAGTVVTAQTRPKTDLSDLHIFPGSNSSNVVLAMSVHPLIPAGTSTTAETASFDPNVLYQFKIDNTGDNVEIVGIRPTTTTVVTGVEMFRKILDEGQAGDNVGCLLRGTKREEIERGQVLCKPGSITPHTKFKSEVYVLKKEEGGRHTPFFTGYRPQFYFRTTDVTGVARLPEGVEMVMPGDNVQMEIELIQPIAMDQGLRFAIREGGRTVGSGVVTEIVE